MSDYKYKISILTSSLLIFIFLFYFFGIRNFFAILNNKASLIYEKRSELKNITFRKLTKDILEKNLVDIETSSFFLNKFFLRDKNYVNFIIFLEEAAKNQGLKYFEINPSIKNNEEILISLNIYDSFPKIMKFIIFLENADYLLTIQSLNINTISKTMINKEQYPGLSERDVNAIINFKLGM